jgi:hypothetical protein
MWIWMRRGDGDEEAREDDEWLTYDLVAVA